MTEKTNVRLPRRRSDVVERAVGDELLLAADVTGMVRVLDPISAALWNSFDGTVSFEELVADLVSVTGGNAELRARQLDQMLVQLSLDGMLEASHVDGIAPRWAHPDLGDGTCLAERLGIARSAQRLVDRDGDVFVFGSTSSDVVDSIAAQLTDTTEPRRDVDAYFARISSGRVPRVQQLFDHMGNTLYASRDPRQCAEALGRTVGGRLLLGSGGTWTHGPSLWTDAGVTLLHPALSHDIVGSLRGELEQRGVGFTPGGLLDVENPTTVLLPPDARDPSATPTAVPLVGVLLPNDPSPHGLERTCIHLARRMDDHHVDRFRTLVDGPISLVPQAIQVVELIELVAATAHGRRPTAEV
jgi:hypothetical protein